MSSVMFKGFLVDVFLSIIRKPHLTPVGKGRNELKPAVDESEIPKHNNNIKKSRTSVSIKTC